MCGIGGILRVWQADQRELALRTPHAQSIPEAWLDILDDAVKHRGPDGQGRFRDRAIRADGCVVDVAFVHRRLSIIDHSGGHQPMVLEIPRSRDSKGALSTSSVSESGGRPIPGRLLLVEVLNTHNRRVLAEAHVVEGAVTPTTPPELALGALSSHDRIAVVFNGCIYNHRELRAELQRAGHTFSTDHSDTEVLVHGWREWGRSLGDRLDGMYAYLLWDRAAGTAFVGRDLAQEKPLYLLDCHSGMYALASTAAALARAQAAMIPAIGNPQWTRVGASSMDWWGDWVRFGGSADPAIAGVFRWPYRGMTQDVQEWQTHPKSLRPLPSRDSPVPLSLDRTEELLRTAVADRLGADVPVACFLSGGIDSSLIALSAAKARGQIDTFSVRMPDPRYDESREAQVVASHIKSRHQTLDCKATPTDDLLHLIPQLGLPLGDSSLLPTYWVSRAARNVAPVALGGDGGDELFCGYERHVAARWLRHMAGALRLTPQIAQGKSSRSRRAKFRRLQSAARYGYAELQAVFLLDDLRTLMPQADFAWYAIRPFHCDDPAGQDFWTSLCDDLLCKVDTASMSVALEVRSPFLSTAMIEAGLRAPYSDLMPRGQRKGLLRQIARKYLPAEIVDRPKMGFAIPIGEWFRSDYGGLRTMLLDHLNSTEPFGPPALGIELNMKFVRQMLDEHLGTGPSGRVVRDHSQRLYMLLVLSIWAKWLGGLKSGRAEGVNA
jgi:asparagine synthase (glutamine-hydrolysing)